MYISFHFPLNSFLYWFKIFGVRVKCQSKNQAGANGSPWLPQLGTHSEITQPVTGPPVITGFSRSEAGLDS